MTPTQEGSISNPEPFIREIKTQSGRIALPA